MGITLALQGTIVQHVENLQGNNIYISKGALSFLGIAFNVFSLQSVTFKINCVDLYSQIVGFCCSACKDNFLGICSNETCNLLYQQQITNDISFTNVFT